MYRPENLSIDGTRFLGRWNGIVPVYDVFTMQGLNAIVGCVKHNNAAYGTVLYRGQTELHPKCANVKRRKGCNKKTVQKDWLEDLVVRETMKLIQDDAVIDKIVQLVMDVQNQENTTIPLLEKQLREVNKKLDNLMKAIEDGLYTRTTKERLEALENQKDELTAKIADEKLKKPSFNEDFIRFWLLKFRKFDISQKKQRKALIEIFVNAIFLYDDRMLITFNYKDGTQTVRFEDTLTADSAEEKSSDLSSSAGP